MGVTTPIAAVAPEHLDALSAALEANLEVLATEERQRVLQDQAERDAVLARTNRVCIGLQEQLFELEAALHAAGDRQAAQAAATEQLVHREAELSAAVAEETALRGSAEQRLAAAQFAREDDSRMHAAEVTSLTTRLGEREALHEDPWRASTGFAPGCNSDRWSSKRPCMVPTSVMGRTRRRSSS